MSLQKVAQLLKNSPNLVNLITTYHHICNDHCFVVLAVTVIGRHHPLDGVTKSKYKLLPFLTKKNLQREEDSSF